MKTLSKLHASRAWIAAGALAAALAAAGCSSDEAPPDPAAVDKANKAERAKAEKDANKPSWFDAMQSKLDKTRVKSADEADMYRFKSQDTVIFHKEPRSQKLLENNKSIDPTLLDQ